MAWTSSLLPTRIELKIDFSTVERSNSALSRVDLIRWFSSRRTWTRDKIPMPVASSRMLRMMTRVMRLFMNKGGTYCGRCSVGLSGCGCPAGGTREPAGFRPAPAGVPAAWLGVKMNCHWL